MASLANGAQLALSLQTLDIRQLRRPALWGLAGVSAMALAAFATTTKTGHERIRLAVAHVHEISKPTDTKLVRPADEMEVRRIAEAVRLLAADRGPLLTRIATIEQGMENVTESVTLVATTARAVQQQQRETAAALSAITPPAAAPSTATQSAAAPPSADPNVPSPSAAARSAPTLPAAPPKDRLSAISGPDVEATASANIPAGTSRQTPQESQIQPPEPNTISVVEYGLDLGGASTVDGVRALWTTAQRRYASQLDGLHPILRLRERTRPAGVELRLVVGPITSATAAAKLCLAMSAVGATCQPTLFDGQRLALR